MTPRIRPSTRITIADAVDAIVAVAAIALMVLAATAVPTASTAVGLVAAPIGEPGLISPTAINTIIRPHAVDPCLQAEWFRPSLRAAVLAERPTRENNHVRCRR